MEIQQITIKRLHPNEGQIEGLPTNPRQIKKKAFDSLKKSIKDAPEMLHLRELIVYPYGDDFVVIGGNMRLRACRELGFEELPCKVLPVETPAEKLREYAIKDNVEAGEDDWDVLANEWNAEELTEWGLETPIKKDRIKDLSDAITLEYKIEVTLPNEEGQENLYNELQERGYLCRILTL